MLDTELKIHETYGSVESLLFCTSPKVKNNSKNEELFKLYHNIRIRFYYKHKQHPYVLTE